MSTRAHVIHNPTFVLPEVTTSSLQQLMKLAFGFLRNFYRLVFKVNRHWKIREPVNYLCYSLKLAPTLS